jgi:hypothetical protein
MRTTDRHLQWHGNSELAAGTNAEWKTVVEDNNRCAMVLF